MPHRQGDLHNYGWNDAVAACLRAIDAHHCYDEAALADATAGLHNFAMAAGDVEHQGAWWHCNAEPCKSYAARLRP